eukprot:CAMPEP_0172837238 /NCGR_PEP_ID=MMETSP1075-20121228/27050_1 /TAXON_ID=2916 /ORGANISM="Ceratium fusus, Strain PA161109" /LENGTH=93 /DNA_ID=CAMNT_0013680593 /DNA_START=399 /DNA_END=678 /DNA_ORIENTATION=-
MDALRGYVSGNASRERRSRAAIDALAKVVRSLAIRSGPISLLALSPDEEVAVRAVPRAAKAAALAHVVAMAAVEGISGVKQQQNQQEQQQQQQ